MTIKDLIKGNSKFKDVYFSQHKNDFRHLVENGQNPEILFIGCSDSRVVPDLIVGSKPGDMFILRNIGNFVPPYTKDVNYHGSSSAIQYAVSILNVKHIIVCGHSHCGACASLYKDLDGKPQLSHVREWLKLGSDAKNETIKSLGLQGDRGKLLRTTERNSIKYQLKNLLTYPEVVKKVKNKEIDIHGWYYEIENGSIEVYDEKTDVFKSLANQI